MLGNDIYKMMGEGIAPYQTLPREMKEAVDLYIENEADFRDVGNVELKPWQESLLEYVQQPGNHIFRHVAALVSACKLRLSKKNISPYTFCITSCC